MKIGHIEIFVKDPLQAKEFYIHILGFTVEDIQKDQYVWMKKGQSEILLRPRKNQVLIEDYQSTNIGIVLYTENLDKTVEELTAKGLKFGSSPILGSKS